jgi:peptidylprolyl isomerase
LRGTVSMARSDDPNSADSQFFICFAPAPWLDGKYTAFGRVASGMEYVDMIKKGNEEYNGEVQDPTHIVKMQVMADVMKQK